MTSLSLWIQGARPRTLPAAVAPVLVGTGAAVLVDGFVWWKALLALGLSLALQVGVNYANDYSDGVKGTDADRVGPLRLVGSGSASASAVKRAALLSLGVGALFGLALAATTTWWFLLVGVAALAAAWTYTGGPSPYGYKAMGEISVFVFFGLVAVTGTTYAQAETIPAASWAGAVGIGALACNILVANNLRDIPTDTVSGKRTLAVVLGDAGTRRFFVVLALVAAACLVWAAFSTPWALLGAIGLLPLVKAARTVLAGATGPALVPVLAVTGKAELLYAIGLGGGLALGAL